VRTVLATRAASPPELEALIRSRLDTLLSLGTTTAEVKSGYGLSHEFEIASCEAIERAARGHGVRVVRTFLGGHEVPLDRRGDRDAFIDELVNRTIPEVARRRLAAFSDVFCERGVFSVAESRRILEAGLSAGLPARIHADELSHTGGAELAGGIRAKSADHLIHVSPAGIEALAAGGVVATLMPGASFFLKLGRFAPARALSDASVPLALGSDANPGGGLSPSMPFAIALACFSMGLSLEEALTAATIGSATSIGLDHEVGSIEPGKRADCLILETDHLIDLVRVGLPPIRTVIAAGVPRNAKN
jgi:imidazolonepropionase